MLGDSSSVAGGGGGGGGHGEAPNETSMLSEVGHNSGEDDRKGGGGGGGDDGDRSFGGNRWPRQETLALLKIRSDMDAAFRDASVKGPLWDEVSRKLAGLGYNRSSKKCKEKFENVFKYHKRTKDGRTGKQEGKTYRFFDQLNAFESHLAHQQSQLVPQSQPPQQQLKPPQAPPVSAIPMSIVSPPPSTTTTATAHVTTVPSAATTTVLSSQGIVTTGINLAIPSFPPSTNPTILSSTIQNPTNLNQSQPNIQSSFPSFSPDLLSNSTSSSTSSDVEIHQGSSRRKKRKWQDFFDRLMKEVIHKQEDMQKKFLEAIEKREHDRMVREESWRIQEMARINREREILAQERSIAAAKDAAVMAFLQKVSEQQNPGQQVQINTTPPPASTPALVQAQPQVVQAPIVQAPPQQTSPQPQATLQPQPQQQPKPIVIPQAVPVALAVTTAQQPMVVSSSINLEMKSSDNGDQSFTPASSSRWPKVEVEALINLRQHLDSKYQENGPKGPLWEEISAGMRKLGYNRNSKRCKEKWENINKYFKKVKESNKRRPEDSKTCPYFHQLDALYKERQKFDGNNNTNSSSSNIQINSVPIMVRPEQQWPPPPQQQHGHHHDSVMDDLESEHDQDDEDDKDIEEDEDDEASGYEIVANSNNRQTSMNSAG